MVALWNSNTNQPGGLEFEVMDMLYGLPFRDWLELNARPPTNPQEIAANNADPENGSGDTGLRNAR